MVGLGLRAFLTNLPDLAKALEFPLLEAEALCVLLSAAVLIFDVPCLVWQICMDALCHLFPAKTSPVRTIMPYGAVYLSLSPRDFWRKWSRPAGQAIRHMLYYPLGGDDGALLAISIMFGANAASHLQLGCELTGNWKGSAWWFVVFGIMGVAVTGDILIGRLYYAPPGMLGVAHSNDNGQVRWFRVARWVVNYVSLRVCVWVFVHEALELDGLSSFLC